MSETQRPSLPAAGEAGPGQILELITSRRAVTRSAIAEVTGLSRSTVTQRLDALFGLGLVMETSELVKSRGRPSRVLRLNRDAAVIGCVDIGEDRTRIAITDLESNILAERVEQFVLSEGPVVLLNRTSAIIRELLATDSIGERALAVVTLGLPAPVDYELGRVQGWSIMSGWEAYDIRTHLGGELGVPVLIDNDVNLLTLAEHRRYWPDERHLLFIKAGTGVGSGMVINGMISRGAQGAAGDIGHAHLSGFGDPPCRCGNFGCLEALVGGWALARDLGDRLPTDGRDARGVLKLARDGDSFSAARLRLAGRTMGEAVAFATSLLNPNVIVLGGALSAAGDHLLAGVREVVYQRTLPLATRRLQIVQTAFKSRAGIAGGAYLGRDYVLSARVVDRAVSNGTMLFAG